MSLILDALKKSEQERRLGQVPGLETDTTLYPDGGGSGFWAKAFVAFLLIIFLGIGAGYYFRQDLVNLFISYQVGKAESVSTVIGAEEISSAEDQLVNGFDKKTTEAIELTNAELNDTGLNADSIGIGSVSSGEEVIRPSAERRQALIDAQEEADAQDESLKQEYQDLFQQLDSQKPIENQTAMAQQVESNNEEKNEPLETQASIDAEVETVSQQDVEESEVIISREAEVGKAAVPEEPTPIEETASIEPSDDMNEVLVFQGDIPKQEFESTGTIADLSSSVKSTLPSIAITTHIYSNAAGYSRVTINGKMYGDGQTVSTGLTVKRITDEGVIFSFRGEEFKMSALQEWKAN